MTNRLHPLAASDRIGTAYAAYLRTVFAPGRDDWRADFETALRTQVDLAKGPFLQATPPFKTAESVDELVAANVLSSGFGQLPAAFPRGRALYTHQAAAIKAALEGRNLLIATGTGSGKTECLLFPAIELLLRERAAGTLDQPGVRALLLYPMNALANDQVRRFRELLAGFPDITFGRYIGATKESARDASSVYDALFPGVPRLPNELLSREEMRDRPPHILVTNFSMLEYLLLRPKDHAFFDGPKGRHWRLIGLDEAHVYDGADGAEIALLLRRLRDRVVASERGRLTYIATSATLGSTEDYPALVDFGQRLFDEPFETRDIIGPNRFGLASAGSAFELPSPTYAALADAKTVAEIVVTLAAACPPAAALAGAAPDVPTALHAVLDQDARTRRLQVLLDDGMATVETAASTTFGAPDARDALVALVEAGVRARRTPSEASLLPARYHFWLRGLEGAFVCLHDAHPASAPRLVLRPGRQCAACAAEDRQATLFELGSCRRCRAEYLVGQLRDSVIERSPVGMTPRVYLLLDAPGRPGLGEGADEGADEDEAVEDGELAGEIVYLCAGCGGMLAGSGDDCSCAVPTRRTRAWHQEIPADSDGGGLRRCGACHGSGTSGEVVGRFLTDTNAPAAVVATALYQEISMASEPRIADKVGGGRKLLAFADSRQEAAFFAPYLERTYGTALRRSLLLRTIRDLAQEGEPVPFELVARRLATIAREARVLDPSRQPAEHRAEVRTWLMQELVALDRRLSLDGVGLVRTTLSLPPDVPVSLAPLGLSDTAARDLVELLLGTLRTDAALRFPDEVDRNSPDFAPRNRDIAMRGEGADPKKSVLAWTPSRGLNRRRHIVESVVRRLGLALDARAILRDLWRELTAEGSPWAFLLPRTIGVGSLGVLYRLASDRHAFVPASAAGPRYRCAACHSITWTNVVDACPAYRCAGTLEALDPADAASHYATLYETLAPIVLTAEEHTAQWELDKGTEIQNLFIGGDINVLSCSTTFELGVDVGDVEAVLLRNVPPSAANYVQRAGRAGRRAGAAAMVVTLAQRRNHDLSWFRDPAPMINGAVKPPVIITDNPVIGRRHAHSVAIAEWLHVEPVFNAGPFALPDASGTSGSDRFIAWLRGHPAALGAALGRILPPTVAAAMDLDGWSWVDDLVITSPSDPASGWLGRAIDLTRDDARQLEEARATAAAANKYERAGQLNRQLNTLINEELVSFLARRNVLPKYGFPVDVVALDLSHTTAAGIKLERDLRMAISEYAPGSEVVAAKKVWRSIGLRRHPSQDWRVRDWSICANCGGYRDGIEAAAECPVCQDHTTRTGGRWVKPIFGFVGALSTTVIGEQPVLRRSSTESWFGAYGATEAQEATPPPGIRPDVARTLLSPQGRIVVINSGPSKAGFRICSTCGWAEPATVAGRRRTAPKHKHPIRGTDCTATPSRHELAHEFLTDVVEVRLVQPASSVDLRSTLYALLEGAGRLGIKRDEIDGTLHAYAKGATPALVIYDTVPGGAGHARRIRDHLADVVDEASRRVSVCDCGEDTSCYGCLRSYGNQLWHDELVRGAAASVLATMRE